MSWYWSAPAHHWDKNEGFKCWRRKECVEEITSPSQETQVIQNPEIVQPGKMIGAVAA